MTDAERELVTALREMREACCAAMRVIAEIDTATRLGLPAETAQQRFVDECHLAGIEDGFGARVDALLQRYHEASR